MKRRGFFGLLAGAAVAGPGMVKEAAAATIADLSVSGLAGGIPLPDWGPESIIGGYASTGPDHSWHIERLAKLAMRSASQHAYHRNRMNVQSLDPDLASYRSFALHQKVRLQRDRNYERSLRFERGELEAQIAGWFD
jgi:hypothetical protein